MVLRTEVKDIETPRIEEVVSKFCQVKRLGNKFVLSFASREEASNFYKEVIGSLPITRFDKMLLNGALASLLLSDEPSYMKLNSPYRLRDYQKKAAEEGLKILSRKKLYNLFLEVGLGKTLVSSVIARALLWQGPADRVLIVVKKSLIPQWIEEVKKFLGYKVKDLTKKPHELKEGEWGIINYESLHKVKAENYIMICDEAQKFKNSYTQTWKRVSAYSEKAVKRINLTGTPIVNGLRDYYNLCSAHKEWRMSVEYLKDNYAVWDTVMTPQGRKAVIVGWKNVEDFVRRYSDITLTMKKKDVAKDLPPVSIQYVGINMDTKQKSNTRKLIKWVDENDDKSILHVFKTLMINELSPHCIQTFKLYHIIDPTMKKLGLSFDKSRQKVDALISDIEDAEGQVLVFTRSKAFAFYVKEELQKAFTDSETGKILKYINVVYGGNYEEGVKKFKNKETDVLISTDVLGEGHSFPDVDTVIFLDPPFSPAEMEQKIGRIHRMNSTRPKLAKIYFMYGGVEARIVNILRQKGEIVSAADKEFAKKTIELLKQKR